MVDRYTVKLFVPLACHDKVTVCCTEAAPVPLSETVVGELVALLTNDTLFHELVHVEQYAQLGTQRFANAYIRGLVNGGFKYENIPLEQIAFALTDRRTRGDAFSVREELQAWLASRKY